MEERLRPRFGFMVIVCRAKARLRVALSSTHALNGIPGVRVTAFSQDFFACGKTVLSSLPTLFAFGKAAPPPLPAL
jgi:hypothetical protein